MVFDLGFVLVALLVLAVAVGLAVLAGRLSALLFFHASGAGIEDTAAPDARTRR